MKKSKTKNHLSEEHVPQNALGGKVIVLTCKDCNNDYGQNVDHHLVNGFKFENYFKFKQGEKYARQINNGGVIVNAEVELIKEDTLDVKIYDSKKKRFNPPSTIKNFTSTTSQGQTQYLVTPEKNFDDDKADIAILKNAYLMLFEKIGRKVIQSRSYTSVRRQLNNYHVRTFPKHFVKKAKIFNMDVENGVYQVRLGSVRAYMCVFELESDGNIEKYLTFLPTETSQQPFKIYELLKKQEKGDSLKVQRKL
ncbi:HNH endonuclease [Flammeovirga sp. EKP202]|uniref:HNH endonuclease n=1 Tax=Flammeovirga sp. EKP202 TaxID=2770592 RepID=UPI00165F797A|nr:HNH endonuclease [Flammeovirga sp. EKP202]MBD0403244.1 hypothetical protein [Flammeovirga sp. EKP202]